MSQNTEQETTENTEQRTFLKGISHEELTTMSIRQKGFIISIRTLDPSLSGDTLKDTIAEMFPPSHLFSNDIKEIPSVWLELRKFLDTNGASLSQHSSRRVILTLAHSLYEDAEDREAAIEMANNIVSEGRRPRTQTQGDSSYSPGRPPDNSDQSARSLSTDRVAHNVAMRLKDKEKKFNGDLGECWHEFVDEYEQMSIDYNLTGPQKLQYLHNIVTKDAHRFYIDRVKAYATTYEQAVGMIEAEYNSPVRQSRVKNYLNSLRMHDFIGDKTDSAAALAKVYRTILKLSRQVPTSHKGDAHRIEFLRCAVVGYDWSREPLSRVATCGLSFQQLYGELEAAVQLEKESKIAKLRDRATDNARDRSDEAVAINFAGQGRYNYPRHQVHTKKDMQKKKHDPLTVMGCFNCDDPAHMAKDCPHPKNFAKSAARLLEYHNKKRTPNSVHLVLAQLCNQLDHAPSGMDDDSTSSGDDAEIFQSMVSNHGGDEANAGAAGQAANPRADEQIDIFSVNVHFGMGDGAQFLGACIDSGAQKTVIGQEQAKAYAEMAGTKKVEYHSCTGTKYKFGDKTYDGLGTVVIRIPITETYFISIRAQVVEVNVPLLLGLDVLSRLKVILNFEAFTMSSTQDKWSIPLTRKLGHAYIVWHESVLYTEAELRRMHRHFYHPATEKLHAVIKRAEPTESHPGMRETLDKIRSTCDTCQRNAGEPHRFRVSMPADECVFNRMVSLDIMSLESSSVLHVVDRDTRFSAACFLPGESANQVWRCFLNIWVSTYIGFPDCVQVDQGPQFKSHEFRSMLSSAGILVQPSGVESHNALGNGERYHAYLRQVFKKIRDEVTSLDKHDTLRLAIKAVNDTAGPNGLVPTLLVFGVLPRLPIHPRDLPDQRDRMQAMQVARAEMARITARARVHVALNRNVPAAADTDIRILDNVLVFRESPVNKWVGPYTVVDVKGKSIYVDVNGRATQFAIDKVRVYRQEGEEGSGRDDVRSGPEGNDDDETGTQPEVQWPDGYADIDEHGRTIEKYWNMDRGPTDEDAGIFTVKILNPTDERAGHDDFKSAMNDEVQGLVKRNIWRIVEQGSVPKNANVMGGRFILTLKNYGTPEECAKVRYVAQGFRDRDKPYMVHDTSTLRISSIRLILSIAAVMQFRCFSHDVTQAYLQSKSHLTREVYIRPKERDKEILGVKDGELFKLIRPLYGLCDAGDYWGETMTSHLINDLKMRPTSGDPSLYYWKDRGKLAGVTGMYVDDLLNAGNVNFQKHAESTLNVFDSKPRVNDHFDFFGAQVDTLDDGTIHMTQRYYARSLKPANIGGTYEEFRRERALFSWMTNTRPDVACVANKAAQVTEKTHGSDKVRELNKGIRIILRSTDIGLKYGKLKKSELHIRAYADASYATNDDLTSQLGYLVLLCDHSDNCHVLDYASRKSKRVVRSIMGGETYAFMDAFDLAFVIKTDLEVILGMDLNIVMFTDSRQLYDSVTCGKRTAERRLSIDVTAARQSYRDYEIASIGLVKGEVNPADGLTKPGGNGALRRIIETGRDTTPVESWIVREDGDDGKGEDGLCRSTGSVGPGGSVKSTTDMNTVYEVPAPVASGKDRLSG